MVESHTWPPNQRLFESGLAVRAQPFRCSAPERVPGFPTIYGPGRGRSKRDKLVGRSRSRRPARPDHSGTGVMDPMLRPSILWPSEP
jgi:hypothetical protein